MKRHVLGLMDFIREQGVIGLAVGLAIGTQAGKAVEAIVEGLINPIVGFILGGSDLSTLKWEIVRSTNEGGRELTIYWGSVMDGIIKLVAVALVIYFVVRGLKLDRLDKLKEAKKIVESSIGKLKCWYES